MFCTQVIGQQLCALVALELVLTMNTNHYVVFKCKLST